LCIGPHSSYHYYRHHHTVVELELEQLITILKYSFNEIAINIKITNNKSAVVAEMGDLLVTIDMGRKLGAAVPLCVGWLGPHLTQCRLDRDLPPYQVAS